MRKINFLIIIAGIFLLAFFMFFPGKVWDDYVVYDNIRDRSLYYILIYFFFLILVYFFLIRKSKYNWTMLLVLYFTFPTISSGVEFQNGYESSSVKILETQHPIYNPPLQVKYNKISPVLFSIFELFQQTASIPFRHTYFYKNSFSVNKIKGIRYSNVLLIHNVGLIMITALFFLFADMARRKF